MHSRKCSEKEESFPQRQKFGRSSTPICVCVCVCVCARAHMYLCLWMCAHSCFSQSVCVCACVCVWERWVYVLRYVSVHMHNTIWVCVCAQACTWAGGWVSVYKYERLCVSAQVFHCRYKFIIFLLLFAHHQTFSSGWFNCIIMVTYQFPSTKWKVLAKPVSLSAWKTVKYINVHICLKGYQKYQTSPDTKLEAAFPKVIHLRLFQSYYPNTTKLYVSLLTTIQRVCMDNCTVHQCPHLFTKKNKKQNKPSNKSWHKVWGSLFQSYAFETFYVWHWSPKLYLRSIKSDYPKAPLSVLTKYTLSSLADKENKPSHVTGCQTSVNSQTILCFILKTTNISDCRS